MVTDFKKREGRERERERNINQLLLTRSPSGTEPTLSVLTGPGTGDLSVYKTMLQPTGLHQPGQDLTF